MSAFILFKQAECQVELVETGIISLGNPPSTALRQAQYRLTTFENETLQEKIKVLMFPE